MNKKGFTLVELLATLVVLSIVVGIGIVSMNVNLNNAKEKTEEVFVDTLKDAIDIYLSSNFSELKLGGVCSNKLSKKYGEVQVYKVYKKNGNPLTFKDIINFKYHSITKAEFVNPRNEEAECNENAKINVYRDEDYVYYYSVDKSGTNGLGCLLNISGEYSSVISNLPEGYVCG